MNVTPTDLIVKQSVFINSLLLGFFFLIGIGLFFTLTADSEHDFSFYIEPLGGILLFLIIAWVNIVRR